MRLVGGGVGISFQTFGHGVFMCCRIPRLPSLGGPSREVRRATPVFNCKSKNQFQTPFTISNSQSSIHPLCQRINPDSMPHGYCWCINFDSRIRIDRKILIPPSIGILAAGSIPNTISNPFTVIVLTLLPNNEPRLPSQKYH